MRVRRKHEDGERLGELEESQLEIHFDLVTDRKNALVNSFPVMYIRSALLV